MKHLPLLILLALTAFTPSDLIKTKLTNGVTVMLPINLKPMTPEDMATRFPSVRAPIGAFTNEDRIVDFSVNFSATIWPDVNVELAQGFFKSSLYNLYDRIDLIGEGTQVLHKKKFIYFEFESRISGDRKKEGYADPVLKYTYIQYLVQKNRTLVFTFTCPKDLREDWEPVAKEIMKSIRVR